MQLEISALLGTKWQESNVIMYKKSLGKWVLSHYSWGSGTLTHSAT